MRHHSTSSIDWFMILGVFAGFAVTAWAEQPTQRPPGPPPTSEPAPSVAGRLGVKFNPASHEEKAAPEAPRVPRLTLAESILPMNEMEPFVVSGPRVKLTERQLLTDKGILALAKKTQLTPLYRVTFGPLSQLGMYYFDWLSILGGWHPNDLEAMILYRQEEQIRRKTEMDALIKLDSFIDEKSLKPLRNVKLETETSAKGWFITPK